jgi:hypothetical protein
MLIDFSVLLRIDVFKVGRTFLKMTGLLNLKIPLVDPSLYLHRFANKLRIKNERLLFLAIRIISRMKRDWIVVGRRPNNLCGAALVVASRIVGDERSVMDVARAVHVSANTINRRLKEMGETESANLSIGEYYNVWLEREEDPPVSREKESEEKASEDDPTKTELCEIKDGMSSVEWGSMGGIDEMDKCEIGEMKLSVPDRSDTPESYRCEIKGSSAKNDMQDSSSESEYPSYLSPPLTPQDDEADFLFEEYDDSEIEKCILSEDESLKREEVWEEMYGEYVKKRKEKIIPLRKGYIKRKKREYSSLEEALRSVVKEKKLSSKINYSAIEDLFS